MLPVVNEERKLFLTLISSILMFFVADYKWLFVLMWSIIENTEMDEES